MYASVTNWGHNDMKDMKCNLSKHKFYNFINFNIFFSGALGLQTNKQSRQVPVRLYTERTSLRLACVWVTKGHPLSLRAGLSRLQ